RRRRTWGKDHGDWTSNQVVRQRRQPINLILSPSVYDCYVLAFDVAGFLQTLSESTQPARYHLGRSGVEKPDNGRCELLRVPHAGPANCCAPIRVMNSRRLMFVPG